MLLKDQDIFLELTPKIVKIILSDPIAIANPSTPNFQTLARDIALKY